MNLDALLKPVADDSPCGPDLAYDDRFFAIENAAKGKPATFLGEQEIPGEPPDWKSVRDGAQGLLQESRDIRLAVLLAKSDLAMKGFAPFRQDLDAIAALLDTFWDSVHPQLDPADPDPIERTNAIADLASREPGGVVAVLYDAPLTGATNFGQFSLRDHEIIIGKREPPASAAPEDLPTLSAFSAAMEATSLDDLRATRDGIEGAIAATKKLESVFRSKSTGSVLLEPLRTVLASALACVQENLQARGEATSDGGATMATVIGGGGGATAALPASVSSREQAIKAIDLAIGFFERHEPSHPAPLLLGRAKALINRPFLDVIDELFKLSDLGEQVRRELGIPPVREE